MLWTHFIHAVYIHNQLAGGQTNLALMFPPCWRSEPLCYHVTVHWVVRPPKAGTHQASSSLFRVFCMFAFLDHFLSHFAVAMCSTGVSLSVWIIQIFIFRADQLVPLKLVSSPVWCVWHTTLIFAISISSSIDTMWGRAKLVCVCRDWRGVWEENWTLN